MTLFGWIRQSAHWIRTQGLWGVIRSLYHVYVGIWLTISTNIPLETNIYEKEWDVLLILDACRTDEIQDVADEYDFISGVDQIISKGSTSSEWVAKTFDANKHKNEINHTNYITGNPFGQEVIEDRKFPPNKETPLCYPNWSTAMAEDFHDIEHVWKFGRDSTKKTVPPRVLTDRAIHVSRNQQIDRLVIHYMQPHAPYLSDELFTGKNLKELKENPDIDTNQIKRAYQDTLKSVLDEIELLLQNIDAETVAITSDHGEAFGEWGAFGHPIGFPHPAVKQVPWITTSATDTKGYKPDNDNNKKQSTEDIQDHLKNLGYL